MPFFVRWTASSMQPIFHRFFGIEARLAADNLLRAPARTGVVIGALAAGVSLMIQTAGVGRSNEIPVKLWIDQVIQADAFVFWGNLTSANSSMTWMDPGVGPEIVKNVPGVERCVGIRFVRPEFRGNIICIVAIDAQDYYDGTTARLSKTLDGLEAFRELPKGNNVVLSENFAIRFGLKVGDTIAIPSRRTGPVELKVVGIGEDYTWTKGTIFLDRARYRELFDDPWVDLYHVYFDKSADKTATFNALRGFAASKKLEVADRAAIRDYLAGIIDKLYTLAYMQQLIVGIVAALGVVTALLISVLQRQRELGLLRAVGATQPQVLRTVLAEATLIGILGTMLGVILGLPMEWYLLRILLFEESGFYFKLIIPWKEAIGIGLIAVATATIAGLMPAWRAMRLRITEAIAYE
jgi:putative ABC transport system permease protein